MQTFNTVYLERDSPSYMFNTASKRLGMQGRLATKREPLPRTYIRRRVQDPPGRVVFNSAVEARDPTYMERPRHHLLRLLLLLVFVLVGGAAKTTEADTQAAYI
jgi:hypothetical protein